MGKVKAIISISPFRIAIVKLELNVGGYPSRLNWGNISPDDFRVREFVSEVAVSEYKLVSTGSTQVTRKVVEGETAQLS